MHILETDKLQAELTNDHIQRIAELGRPPSLAIYLGCGPDGAVDGPSANYVNKKLQYGRGVGMHVIAREMHSHLIADEIRRGNEDEQLDGQMVQLPVPGVDRETGLELCELVNPDQDIDGLHSNSPFTAATALGIDRFLSHLGIDKNSARVTINGSESQAVGMPLRRTLEAQGSQVISIDRKLGNDHELRQAIAESDVVISCTGVPGIISSAMLHSGLYVIDAGLKVIQNSDGKMVQRGDLDVEAFGSDVDFYANRPTNSIGPLTIRLLAENAIMASELNQGRRAAA